MKSKPNAGLERMILGAAVIAAIVAGAFILRDEIATVIEPIFETLARALGG